MALKGTITEIKTERWSGCLYLPPQYETEAQRSFPAAYLNSGDMREELAVIMERLEPDFDRSVEPFAVIAYDPEDWNAVYTPWPAPAVFGKEEFGGHADEYLELLTNTIKPWAESTLRVLPEPENTALMGYSLGGLAVLYAIYRYGWFGRAASLSGSLWYDGFTAFMEQNRSKNKGLKVYLSLGKKESKNRNKRMRTVTEATQRAYELLTEELTIPPLLVWNEGGHFDGIPERWEEAFRYLFAAEPDGARKGGREEGQTSMPGIFDSHAHYDDKAFDLDREELLKGFARNGISEVVNIGASLESSKRSIALAEEYPFIYAAAGVHPSETEELNEENFKELERMAAHPKVVAIGEIGLDYYWDTAAKEIQKKWFDRQLLLACEKGLPVVIHSRDAAQDTLDMMKAAWQRAEASGQLLTGVIHCFSYGKEMAAEYLRMGFYIGIGGVLTFKNAKKLKEVAAGTPLSRILLETDCPYLTPEPYRGKRNCSLYLPYVVKALSQIKELDEETVIRITGENARRMYGL